MRISFDLDDTLICYAPGALHEPIRVPLRERWRKFEPLRLGAASLLRDLQERHELWIYTTSLREPRAVKRWLSLYGVHIHSVINADLHAKQVRSREWSKLPSHFGIALHIDDEDYRYLGEQFGFEWLLIAPDDPNWTDTIRAAVTRLEVMPLRKNGNDAH